MSKSDIEVNVVVKDGKNTLVRTTQSSDKLGKSLDKTARSAHSADRNIKGAAEASSNSTKNFSKMAQGISKGIVPAYATLAANIFAVGAAFRALSASAQNNALEEGLARLGDASGRTYHIVAKNLQEATGNAYNLEESMRAVAMASSAGISSSQIEELGKVAKNASIALGRDLNDSMSRVIRGAVKMQSNVLDDVGLMVNVRTATAQYAAELGVSADKLTDFQRRQAFVNAMLREGEKNFGAIGEAVKINSFDTLLATFQDMISVLGGFAAKTLGPLVDLLNKSSTAFIGMIAAFTGGILNQMFPVFDDMAQETQKRLAENKKYFADLMQSQSVENTKAFKSLKENYEQFGAATKRAIDIMQHDPTNVKAQASAIRGMTTQISAGERALAKLKADTNNLDHEAIAAKEAMIAMLKQEREHVKQLANAKAMSLRTEKKAILSAREDALGNVKMTAVNALDSQIASTIEKVKAIGTASIQTYKVYIKETTKAAMVTDGLNNKLNILQTSFIKLKGAARAAATTMSLVGKAIFKFVPIIGQILFAFGLLQSILIRIGDAFGLLDTKYFGAYKKQLKETREILDSVGDKTAEIDRIRESDSYTTAEKYTRTLIIQSNQLNEIMETTSKLIKAQKELEENATYWGKTVRNVSHWTKVATEYTLNSLVVIWKRAKYMLVSFGLEWRLLVTSLIKETAGRLIPGLGSLMDRLKSGMVESAAAARKEAQEAEENLLRNKSRELKISDNPVMQAIEGLYEFDGTAKLLMSQLPEYFKNAAAESYQAFFDWAVKSGISIEGLEQQLQSFWTAVEAEGSVFQNFKNLGQLAEGLADTMKTAGDAVVSLANDAKVSTPYDSALTGLQEVSKNVEQIVANMKEVGASSVDAMQPLIAAIEKAPDQFTKLLGQNFVDEIVTTKNLTKEQAEELQKVISLRVDELGSLQRSNILLGIQNKLLKQASSAMGDISRVAPEAMLVTFELQNKELKNSIEQTKKLAELNARQGEDTTKYRLEILELQNQIVGTDIQHLEVGKAALAITREENSVRAQIQNSAQSIRNIERERLQIAEQLAAYATYKTLDLNAGQMYEVAKRQMEEDQRVALEKYALAVRTASIEEASRELDWKLLEAQTTLQAARLKALAAESEDRRYVELAESLQSTVSESIDRQREFYKELADTRLEEEKALLQLAGDRYKIEFIKAQRAAIEDTELYRAFSTSLKSSLVDVFKNDTSVANAVGNVATAVFSSILDNMVNRLVNMLTDVLSGNTAAIKMINAFEVGGNSAAAKMAGAMTGGSAAETAAQTVARRTGDISFKWPTWLKRRRVPDGIVRMSDPSDPNGQTHEGVTPGYEHKSRINSGSVNSESLSAVAEALQKAPNRLQTMFSNAWQGFSTVLQTGWSALQQIFTWFTSKIASLFAASSTSGGGLASIFKAASSSATLAAAANGAIFAGGFQAFAKGGVVSKPTLGLVGEGRHNEAIVPLPNGRAIPVDMKSSGGPVQNNVSVSINMENGSAQVTSNNQDVSQFGEAIAGIVQRTIIDNMRPGGLLAK